MQKFLEARQPRSNQSVSVSWHDGDINAGTHRAHASRLHFEVAECVETKTVTTTTTTKRSFPPLFIREPRKLRSLDSKEYPLAGKPTPLELCHFTLGDGDYDGRLLGLDDDYKSPASEQREETDHAPSTTRESHTESLAAERSPRRSKQTSHTGSLRRSRRNTRAPSPSVNALARQSHRPAKAASSSSSGSDKLRRVATQSSRRDLERSTRGLSSAGYPATPDTSETHLAPAPWPRASRLRNLHLDNLEPGISQSMTSTYEDGRPTTNESQMIYSNVATPPITDADLPPFSDPNGFIQSLRPQRPSIDTVAAQDASLPSPRLSPNLSAAQLPSNQLGEEEDEESAFSQQLARIEHRSRWLDSQSTKDGILDLSFHPTHKSEDGTLAPIMGSRRMDPKMMLEKFDALPNGMKSFMMYQFLRRCPRKTLHMVADVVNPALKCDFLKQLPLELSLHVLSYLDHRDLCRVAQVSKQWRHIVDSNETGWKELFDRDGFVLAPGELQKAISQGWGWQDPVGAEGCELDLSLQNRLTSTETELHRSAARAPKNGDGKQLRVSKRKRGNYGSADRVKRRASVQEAARDADSPPAKMHKSEGPISAANAAAIAVPDPHIGLPNLRRLHLFKSLYRRHYMIRQNWTSGKVKPGHVAFAAHPRHVITCLQFDEDKIVTGSDDTLIHVYDTKTGKLRTRLEGHEGGVWALQYEGNTMVSGSTDRSVRVWDIQKGICTQTFFGHTSTVRCLQILMPADTGKVENGQPVIMPPKPLIITGSRDSQLRVWRLPEPTSRRYIQTGPPASDELCPYFVRILSGHSHSVRAISAHADTLVSGSYDNSVRVWRVSTGEQLLVLTGHTQKVYSVVLDHKRNRCISGSMDSLVKIWDLETGACLHTLEGHSLLVGLLDLRDERLVSAAADSTLRVWDPDNGKCKSTLTARTGAITCFQHDGRKVISGSEKTVKMWDIQTGDCIDDLLTDLSGVWQVKFDERRCVAAVQRDNLTYVEVLDFGAVRDGKPRELLGQRQLLNDDEVQTLLAEEV